MFRYAQINENGTIDADSYLSGIVEAENMIPLAPDFDLTNKRWNGTEWEEISPRLPTPEEAMQAKLDYIMMMAE